MRYAERLSTLVFLVTFLSSCTAALMVADQDDDINIIDVGTSRESIEKKIGNPVETKYLESGELYYVYKVRADEEMARNTISDRLSFATMWIIYDVYYLFIPEILAAPTTVPALVTGKKIGKLREISVLYDSQNRVRKPCMKIHVLQRCVGMLMPQICWDESTNWDMESNRMIWKHTYGMVSLKLMLLILRTVGSRIRIEMIYRSV